MDASPAVERRVHEHLERLANKAELQRAHVVIETYHSDRPSATTFGVHVHLQVKGNQIEATKDTDPDRSHTTIWTALRDAMQAAGRQLDNLHSQRVADRKHRASIAGAGGT